MKDDIHMTNTFFNKKQIGMKFIVVWATLLTIMATYNFIHNLDDSSKSTVSTNERQALRSDVTYLQGSVNAMTGCSNLANQNGNQPR